MTASLSRALGPLLLIATVFPATAAKAPKALVVREGLTAEELEADGKTCLDEAKAAERGEPIAPGPAGSGTSAQMAGAFASGFAKGLNDMERFMAAHDACLARLGYRQVELTAEERREYGKIKDADARTAYVLEFSRRAIEAGK